MPRYYFSKISHVNLNNSNEHKNNIIRMVINGNAMLIMAAV